MRAGKYDSIASSEDKVHKGPVSQWDTLEKALKDSKHFNKAGNEEIDKDLLQGVDSDDDLIDELVKNAAELKALQQEVQDKRNENEEVEKLMQF